MKKYFKYFKFIIIIELDYSMWSQPLGLNAPQNNQFFEADEQTMLELRKKFKCKKALYYFMVHKAVSWKSVIFVLIVYVLYKNVFLPEEKNCPIGFLHQILAGEKHVFWNF